MKKDINLFDFQDSVFLKKVKSKEEVNKADTCEGYLIESSEPEARRIIESLKKSGKLIALVGGDDSFNRRAVETLKIDYLVNVEINTSPDNLRQRDSGLNDYLAKEANRKNITLVINFNEIRNLSKKEKVKRIEKILQNIKISKRAKIDLKIASFALNEESVVSCKERMSFGKSLGMSSLQAKKAVKF